MTDETERNRRDDEDAAVVIALLSVVVQQLMPAPSGTLWGDPAYALRELAPSPTSWWASGLPR